MHRPPKPKLASSKQRGDHQNSSQPHRGLRRKPPHALSGLLEVRPKSKSYLNGVSLRVDGCVQGYEKTHPYTDLARSAGWSLHLCDRDRIVARGGSPFRRPGKRPTARNDIHGVRQHDTGLDRCVGNINGGYRWRAADEPPVDHELLSGGCNRHHRYGRSRCNGSLGGEKSIVFQLHRVYNVRTLRT